MCRIRVAVSGKTVQAVGGEIQRRGFAEVKRAEDFRGERRLRQAEVLMPEGEEQVAIAVDDRQAVGGGRAEAHPGLGIAGIQRRLQQFFRQ